MAIKTTVAFLRPYWITFLGLQFLTRAFLLVYSHAQADVGLFDIIQIFTTGFVFDLETLGFAMIPVILLHLAIRPDRQNSRVYPALRLGSFFIFAYVWMFSALSEFFFWQEFATRFNFIAVDYLVYTQEVFGNIRESYPLFSLLTLLAVLAFGLTWVWRDSLRAPIAAPALRGWRMIALLLILAPFVFNVFLSQNLVPQFNDVQSAQELAKNGTYELFSAYRNNELDFKGFYLVKSEQDVAHNMRHLLEEEENEFLNNDPEDITRVIRRKGPEIHKNVIMVVMESMGADFMKHFGDTHGLTPNLDRLADNGLFFSNLYATGTRTVRGLEALSLSIPPTPGQSILRRKNNDSLFTIGSVFADRGYDTAFIYGGYGYFDNMNAYFAANGFRIVDRTNFPEGSISFSNVWGVCDEDLFKQVMQQADTSYNKHQKFFHMVMTTSNHRPYTFPEGRIDLPAKGGGRWAGVKYADFAVGEFIKEAQHKKWFKDTVFIFVADHTAGAGGKMDLSVEKYHIPAIFYAPGFIKKQDYKLTASQIDVPPVLLGLLNFSYATKFFGEDLLNDPDEVEHPHAFISNYQKVALLRGDKLSVLMPKRLEDQYAHDVMIKAGEEDPRLLLDTVSYYQYASGWRTRMKRIPTVLK